MAVQPCPSRSRSRWTSRSTLTRAGVGGDRDRPRPRLVVPRRQRDGPRQGTWKWTFAGYTDESTLSTWDPPNRLVTTGNEGPYGAKHLVRLHGRIPGGRRLRDPLRAQRRPRRRRLGGRVRGDERGRPDVPEQARPVPEPLRGTVRGQGRRLRSERPRPRAGDGRVGVPSVSTTTSRWATRSSLAPQGVDLIEGEIDHVSPHFIGVLTEDAIYRFIHGFAGETLVGHVFAPGPTGAAREAGRVDRARLRGRDARRD